MDILLFQKKKVCEGLRQASENMEGLIKNKHDEFTPYSVSQVHDHLLHYYSQVFKHTTRTLLQPLFKSPISEALTSEKNAIA